MSGGRRIGLRRGLGLVEFCLAVCCFGSRVRPLCEFERRLCKLEFSVVALRRRFRQHGSQLVQLLRDARFGLSNSRLGLNETPRGDGQLGLDAGRARQCTERHEC